MPRNPKPAEADKTTTATPDPDRVAALEAELETTRQSLAAAQLAARGYLDVDAHQQAAGEGTGAIPDAPQDTQEVQRTPSGLEAGALVRHRYVDPYAGAGGAEVVKHGVVLDVTEDAEGTARPTVAWLNDIATGLTADDFEIAG
jgi:hypothetical protein